MSPHDLIERCREAVEARRALGVGDPDATEIFLQVRGRWGNRRTARLLGRSGPRGRIVGDVTGIPGTILVAFSAVEVAAYIDRHLSVEVWP